MALRDTLRSPFAFLFARSKTEEVLGEYVVREHAKGRDLDDILGDHYVQNRATPEQVARMLERPEVVHAIGQSSIEQTRASLDSLGS